MAKGTTSCFCFLSLFLVILAFHLAEAAVPAIFVFGDSTVDVGTNNFLPTSQAKANFLYYGIDYLGSVPTGRFSNGYNCADRIAKLFGFRKSPESFFHLINETGSFQNRSFKKRILQGVNFASGGSGILDSTGFQLFTNVVWLREQIQQFSTVRGNITEILGPEAAAKMLSKSLFLISVGGNDLFEYQLNVSKNDPNLPQAQELIAILSSTYQIHLRSLYDLGARKFGIVSIPAIGCCPKERGFGNGECNKEMNDLAQAFFSATDILLQNLTSQVQEMKYSLANLYEISHEIISNPGASGFTVAQTACCGNGSYNAQSPCNLDAKLCPNRRDYVFWDSIHPTQRAAKLAARALFNGGANYATPVNFSQLVED
ncbi:unnamed protein product [Dovyalis caffra]|uniref:GDSL esterase/lipase n=1 Tax=Dovyalis caffra TaxID=77055 RepID=A0AAV1SSC9_9ROSI|nr:unnamed protein product [Dovyalis caffra]